MVVDAALVMRVATGRKLWRFVIERNMVFYDWKGSLLFFSHGAGEKMSRLTLGLQHVQT